jgi:hypothetical protein
VTARLDGLRRWLDELDPYLLVARLSLFVAIVNNHSDLSMALFFSVAAAVLFFQEGWLRSPWPWLAMAAVLGWTQLQAWWLVDDHPVATTYWLAAIGVSRFGRRPDEVLALSARLLIGALFALAFSWKVLSGPFVSGDFFEYTLVRDQRFEPVAVVAGGSDKEALERDRLETMEFTATAAAGESIEVETGPRTRAVAMAFTWFGLLMEGAVAAAFLAPLRRRWLSLRAAALIGFCLTTYAVVPVAGFALLLLTMGLAHTRRPWARRAHVAAGVVVLVWDAFLVAVVL